jgi:hypothetical protein
MKLLKKQIAVEAMQLPDDVTDDLLRFCHRYKMFVEYAMAMKPVPKRILNPLAGTLQDLGFETTELAPVPRRITLTQMTGCGDNRLLQGYPGDWIVVDPTPKIVNAIELAIAYEPYAAA